MISPSSLDRRILCPGSERIEAAAPPPTGEKDYNKRGTKLHECMRQLVETGVCTDMERGYLEAEDEAALRWTWEQVRPSLEDAKRLGGSILVEHRIDLSSVGMNVEDDPERCRLDLAIVHGDRAILWDYKFGQMYSPRPKYSWQFKSYALGLVLDFGVKEVQCIRLQPANSEQFRNQQDTFTEAELLKLADKVKEVAAASADPKAPLVIGSKQCQFCRGRDTCPARAGAVMGMPMHKGVRAHLEEVSPEERQAFYELVLVAQDWTNRARADIEAFIMEGKLVPGFAIGDGAGRRDWASEDSALVDLRALAVNIGKNPDELVIKKVVSPAQAEKFLGTGKDMKAEIAKLTMVKPGSPRVVRLEKN